jgi:hypothetical protein
MLHQEITKDIIAAAMDVLNELKLEWKRVANERKTLLPSE